MPIHCRIPLRRLTQQEFGELSYGVLREVFAIHNIPLYEAGLTHFLGGDAVVLRPVQVLLDSTPFGEQPFRHAAEDVAFRLTAFEDPRAFERFLPQVDRLVRHTSLRALLWVNIARSRVTFTTVAPKEAGRNMGAGK
ncbi:MAG: hypothetical protein NTY19_43610 [Planctomycetota bacterium]|nr:hypothetical protein [Planctomycetota bacterium]